MAIINAPDPCAPPPPRCRTRIAPLFNPGISTRRIPSCRPPLCEGCREGQPEWFLTYRGTLDRSNWIKGWAAGQLFNRGQAECGEIPVHKPPKRAGGWWADSFRRDGFKTGSALWLLQWARVNNETLTRAKAYAEEALEPLITWGIASRITIEASYVSRRVMKLAIHIFGPGVSANMVVEGEGRPDGSYLWVSENNEFFVPALGQEWSRQSRNWMAPEPWQSSPT